jgi:murein DD-endopeptidase MepM/ murein hydrolase activator NlpD
MQFPLPFIPTVSYKGGNGFGASRERVRAGLRHAANDLRAEPGTPVLAMEDGLVIDGPHEFFRGTFDLAIKHSQFIARYCEISGDTEVRKGDKVVERQVIAYVGDQPGHDMLHLEFFRGTKTGGLSFAPGTHPPFDRRDDVFNGVRFLDASRHTAFYFWQTDHWRFETDAEGRKFVARMNLNDI